MNINYIKSAIFLTALACSSCKDDTEERASVAVCECCEKVRYEVGVDSLIEGAQWRLVFDEQPESGIVTQARMIPIEGVSVAPTGLTEVQIEFLMPQHNHGTNSEPVWSFDDSSIKIEDILLHMPGQWQFRLQYKVGSITYRATGEFVVI